MATDPQPRTDAAQRFPDCVPVLRDRAGGVRLRPHEPGDTADLVEACRDPQTIRWTTVPVPDGGYTLSDAQSFLELVATGWADGDRLTWAIEAERGGRPRFCGSIHLLDEGAGRAEVGFLLHPAARGRSLMSSALRLVRDQALGVAGFEAVCWRSLPGNWASRRAAAAAGSSSTGPYAVRCRTAGSSATPG